MTSRYTAILSVFYLVCGTVAFAQTTYEWEAQTSPSFGLLDIQMMEPSPGDTLIGWAVGHEDANNRTLDGGLNWNGVGHPLVGLSDTLRAVHFVDPMTGYIVAGGYSFSDSGAVLKSTDGGATWSTVFDTTFRLGSVFFADSTTGYVTGLDTARILKTTDGGVTWTVQVDTGDYGSNSRLSSIAFQDANKGIAAGDSAGEVLVLETYDGGTTWSRISFGPLSPVTDMAITPHDSTYWILTATSGLIRGELGGVFNTLTLPTTSGGGTAIGASDSSNAIVADVADMYQTSDNGVSWNGPSTFADGTKRTAISMLSPTVAWTVSEAAGNIHYLVRQPVLVSIPSDLYGPADSTVKASINISNTDPVEDFLSINMTLTFEDSILNFDSLGTIGTLTDGWLFDDTLIAGVGGPDTLIIAGADSSGTSTDGVLLELFFTVDSNSVNGDTTALVFEDFIINEGFPPDSTIDGFFENAMLHLTGDVDGNNIIQALDASYVLQENVRKFSPSDSNQIERMDVSGNGTIRAFDAALILQHVAGLITTFPAGSSFIAKPAINEDVATELVMRAHDEHIVTVTVKLSQVTATYAAELEIDFDSQHFTYLGYSVPEGSPDFVVEVQQESAPLTIAMASPQALEEDGALIHLRFRLSPNAPADAAVRLTSLFLNEYRVLGTYEAITTDGLPTTYDLAQNYPNPFNPTTTIRYQIPETGRVAIQIYDILGRTVTTLVDESLPAGFYRVDWDGRNNAGFNVASGVYIYHMNVNGFSKVQKMLLMK